MRTIKQRNTLVLLVIGITILVALVVWGALYVMDASDMTCVWASVMVLVMGVLGVTAVVTLYKPTNINEIGRESNADE
jgi:hypothetical protein